MKFAIRFSLIVALCTLAVLAAIPPTVGAQTIKPADTVTRPKQPPQCLACDPGPAPAWQFWRRVK